MSGHDVVIAGGGPTGLMLAAELALAKVDAVVLERRPTQELAGSRAGGLHARTIEILDQRGVAERFLEAGETAQAAGFALNMLDISDFPTRHPYALGLFQNQIERIMAAWVLELGVPIEYGREAVGFSQDEDGVEVEVADGERLRAAYLVGCDGGRSRIRRAAGIEFPGWDATTSALIAELEMAEEPQVGSINDELGVRGINVLADGKTVRVIITDQRPGAAGDASMDELSAALITAYGTDFGIHSPIWVSRFTDSTRQASSYREGRVLLAGDSAHIHYPSGGQGIQNGIQDAVNLGWKLAQVVHGTAPEDLLDTYQAERHPVTARTLKHTMAQTALMRPDRTGRVEALREAMAEALLMDEPRKHFGGLISQLDIQYDLGDGHPLLGRRMPDLDLETSDGPLRVYALLHEARPVLLNLGEPSAVELGAWTGRLQFVEAHYDGPWELPVFGEVTAPTAVLVRPDGHVAWVGENGGAEGLTEALAAWFGAPAAA
ncbi:MAG: FAD-dependent monooxygenase [Actinobacteria bacterium]|nr:FAD-dependent monooxygenase [Actinomycetota bacterium]